MRTFLIAALMAFGLSAPAMAEAKISLWGYNFSNPSDVVLLHDKLASAAKRACDNRGDRSLNARQMERDCRAAFMAEAVAKIDRPTVTAFYNALSPREQLARLGDRAPQAALAALAAATPTAAIRTAAGE